MTRPRKVVIDKQTQEVPFVKAEFTNYEPKITQDSIDYKGFVITVEPSGRTIISTRGLHFTEWKSDDVEAAINRAKGYIDNALR